MGWAMWIYPVGTYLDFFFVFVLVFLRPALAGRPASDFFSPYLLPLSLYLSLFCIRKMRCQVQNTRNTHPTHTDQIGFGSADALTRLIGLRWEIGTGQAGDRYQGRDG